jgi:hypothetical protein
MIRGKYFPLWNTMQALTALRLSLGVAIIRVNYSQGHGGPILQRAYKSILRMLLRPNDDSTQVNNGFLEGIIRGYKAGILTQSHYASLTQCESLEGIRFTPSPSRQAFGKAHLTHPDLKTQLSATDYGNFLANEPSPLSTATISDRATQILVDQFNFARSNAVEPLGKFLDYITSVSLRDYLRVH